MKLKTILQLVDSIKPNAFDPEIKVQWLNECEGLVQTEIMLLAPEEVIEYTWAEDQETELLAGKPHHKIYWVYLAALIDFAHGEFDKYNNAVTVFNAYFAEYQRWYTDAYRPADGEPIEKGYYLSAYGIAVKHGFTGSEEAWLISLMGPPGKALTFDDLTEEQIAALKGDPFRYEDFTEEQLKKLQGPAGETPVFSVGTVETLKPGSEATATMGGTATKPVLNLGIPAGRDGADGYGGAVVSGKVLKLTSPAEGGGGTGGGGTLTPATTEKLGGIIVGDNLKVEESGRLSVDTATEPEADNTKPITAAAVQASIGNIEVLLQTI